MKNETNVYRKIGSTEDTVYLHMENGLYALLGLAYFDSLSLGTQETVHGLAQSNSFSGGEALEPGILELYKVLSFPEKAVEKEDEWFGMTEGDMIDELVERQLESMSVREVLEVARKSLVAEYDCTAIADVRAEYQAAFGESLL